GIYDVILTVTNLSTSKSCNTITGACPDQNNAPSCGSDMDTIQVIIYPGIVPIATVPDSACTQEVINLNSASFCTGITPVTDACIDSLIWNFSPNVNFVQGTNANSEDPNVVFQSAVTHNVTLTLFPLDNCPPVDTSFVIQVFEGVGASTRDTTACDSLTLRPFDLINNLSGSTPDFIEWDLGSQGIFNVLDPGVFTYFSSETITLTVENSCNTVVSNVDVNIIVPDIGMIDQADFEVCEDDPPLPLTANPPGSDWVGPGISSDGIFDPAQANINANTIIYGGFCVEPDTIVIQVNALPTIDPGPDQAICIEDPDIPLLGTPSGDWVYQGDTLSLPVAPTFFGIGSYTLEYRITDPVTLCENRDSITIQIDSVPVLNIIDTLALCISPEDVDLETIVMVPENQESDLTWSGPGITNPQTGIFNGGGLSAGVYELLLAYNINACPVNDTLYINLTDAEEAQLGPDIQVCSNDGTFTLAATPSGGLYSGVGIDPATGEIDLATALTGNGEFIYEVFSGTTCENSDTIFVEIIDVASLSAPNQSACETEQTITLTASLPNGVWSGSNAETNAAILNANTGLIDVQALSVQDHTFTYTLTPEPNLSACTFSVDIAVTIFPQPMAGFTVADTVCVNTPVPFTNTSVGNQSNTWDFGDGSPTVSTPDPIHTFLATGTYSVELIIQSGDLCTDTVSQVVEVIELPTNVSFLSLPEEQCAPATFDFVGMASGPDLSYAWQFGNFQTSDELSPTGIFFAQGQSDTTYAVSFTVSNDCGSVTVVDSVTVRPLPVASFGTDFNSYCSGQPVDIENNSFGDPDTIKWDYGNGMTSVGFDPIDQIYVTDTTVVVTITLTLENECGFDTLARDIIIEPSELTAFFNSSDSILCPGEQVCLTNFATTGSTVFYAVSTGDTLFVDNPCFTFPGPGNYSITQFSVGCGFDTFTQNYVVNGLPPVAISFDPQVCRGEPVPFTSTTNGAIGFNWDFGEGNTSDLANPTHVFDTSGIFQVTLLINSDSCDNSVTQMIEVLDFPPIAFTFQDSVCAGTPMAFVAQAPMANSYSWDFGDGNIGSGPALSHTFATSGTFDVILTITDDNGCMNQLVQQVFVNPVPTSDFVFQILEPCDPGQVSFTAISSGSFDSFLWLFGDGDSSPLSNPVHDYASPGIYPVSLITGFGGICFDTITQNVEIFPTPDPSFSPVDPTGCEDLTIDFSVDNPDPSV
ncbi:MAG: PKD domain-containing protein, partial [Bacteroidota bacterium]